jgi:hypothetical protein
MQIVQTVPTPGQRRRATGSSEREPDAMNTGV